MSEPIFMRKPKHKKTVVATSKGWEVESTGELLVSVRGLDQKIKDYLQSQPVVDANVIVAPTVVESAIEDVLKDVVESTEPLEITEVFTLEDLGEKTADVIEPVADVVEEVAVVEPVVVAPADEKPAPKKRGPKPKNKPVV